MLSMIRRSRRASQAVVLASAAAAVAPAGAVANRFPGELPQSTPMMPTPMRLPGATFPPAPIAEAGTIAGPAHATPAAAAVDIDEDGNTVGLF